MSDYIEEIAPWAYEQWKRFLNAAQEFEASMKRLQAMAGESSAQLADVQQGLLALAEGEQEA